MQQYSNDSSVNYDDWYARREGRARGIALGIVAAIAVGGIAAGLIWWHYYTHPAIVAAPTSFITYTALDGGFQVAAPSGWKSSASSSMATNSGVDFREGPCKISVSSDLGGSLMGDIAQSQAVQQQNIASQAGLPPPVVTPPVEKLHQAGKQDMNNEYPGYSELPMLEFQCPAGPARVSEFTSDTQNGAPIYHLHGYRATILNINRRITVIAVCPQQNWTLLAPAFQHVLQSVTVSAQ